MFDRCPSCGGPLAPVGAEVLDSDGSAMISTRCPCGRIESASYRNWKDDLFGDVDEYSPQLVDVSLRADADGSDVCVVATAGPDARFLGLPTLRDSWDRESYLRAADGGPFEPDSAEDDLALASHFYKLGIPGRQP